MSKHFSWKTCPVVSACRRKVRGEGVREGAQEGRRASGELLTAVGGSDGEHLVEIVAQVEEVVHADRA